MDVSEDALIELLLQVAGAKDDETAQHVLMAARRFPRDVEKRSIIGSVADGLGVPLV